MSKKKNIFDKYIDEANKVDDNASNVDHPRKSPPNKPESTDEDTAIDLNDDLPSSEIESSDTNDFSLSRKNHILEKPSVLTPSNMIESPHTVFPWGAQFSTYNAMLIEAGYTSVKLLATATVKEVNTLTDIPMNVAQQLILKAQEWFQFNFETAATLLDQRSEFVKISTGSKNLDRILGGGVEPKSLTEFYGSYTTGKTQVCIQLAVNAVLPAETGGDNGYAIYIDTEGAFRPERIMQICGELGIDHQPILDHILIGRAHNSSLQMQMVNKIYKEATDKNFKIIIVDSLTSNFRSEYVGKGALMERQQKLNQHVQQLSRISDMLAIPVVFTNQVMSVIDGFENTVLPVGGNILAHGSTHRVQFTKSDKHPQVRYAKLVASPSLPEASASFQVTMGGIQDVSIG